MINQIVGEPSGFALYDNIYYGDLVHTGRKGMEWYQHIYGEPSGFALYDDIYYDDLVHTGRKGMKWYKHIYGDFQEIAQYAKKGVVKATDTATKAKAKISNAIEKRSAAKKAEDEKKKKTESEKRINDLISGNSAKRNKALKKATKEEIETANETINIKKSYKDLYNKMNSNPTLDKFTNNLMSGLLNPQTIQSSIGLAQKMIEVNAADRKRAEDRQAAKEKRERDAEAEKAKSDAQRDAEKQLRLENTLRDIERARSETEGLRNGSQNGYWFTAGPNGNNNVRDRNGRRI